MAERIQPAKELTAQEILEFVNNIPALDEKIGANNSSASNSLTANQNAKLNWLLMNLNTLVTGRVVKSVQRGRASFTAPDKGATVVISQVLTNKSLLFIGTPINISGGGLVTVYTANGVLTNGNRIDISTASSNATAGTVIGVDWQLIEFY